MISAPIGGKCGKYFQASVKNFQIVSASDPSQVIMQFGKVGADVFTMDFR